MDLSKEKDRGKERCKAARPHLVAKFTEINLNKIGQCPFSSSPDLIEGTRDGECTIKEEHGRKGGCSAPKQPVMSISGC